MLLLKLKFTIANFVIRQALGSDVEHHTKNDDLQSCFIDSILTIDEKYISERWDENEFEHKLDILKPPDKWNINETYFSETRIARRFEYVEITHATEDNYLIQLKFPVDFLKAIKNEKDMYCCNVSPTVWEQKMPDDIIVDNDMNFYKDYFLSALGILHNYTYAKFYENDKQNSSNDKFTGEDKGIKEFAYANFNHKQICALNWLIKYFYEDMNFDFLFMFPDLLKIKLCADKFSLMLRFDFSLPLLDKMDYELITCFISDFDVLVSSLCFDLLQLLNYEDETKRISKAVFAKCNSFYNDETHFLLYFSNFLKFLKIRLSIVAVRKFVITNYELYVDETEENQPNFEIELPDSYYEYYEKCEVTLSVFHLQIEYDITQCLYLFTEIDIDRLLFQIRTLKKNFVKILLAINKLYALCISDKLLFMFDLFEFQIKQLKKISPDNSQKIDIFYNNNIQFYKNNKNFYLIELKQKINSFKKCFNYETENEEYFNSILKTLHCFDKIRKLKVCDLLQQLNMKDNILNKIGFFNSKIDEIANTIIDYKKDINVFTKLYKNTHYILESYVLNTVSDQEYIKKPIAKIESTLDEKIIFRIYDKFLFERNDFYFLYQEYNNALKKMYNEHLLFDNTIKQSLSCIIRN